VSEHAILPPSSADQWGNCSGWVRAVAGVANPDTEKTIFGTASHWVFSESFERSIPCADFIGSVAPNGYVICEKAAEGAQVMVNDINKTLGTFPDEERVVFCEHRVYMPGIHRECWGTLDWGVWYPARRLLVNSDYKAGNRSHEAKDHLQTDLYLNGLANELKLNGLDDQRTRVVKRIVQPFSYKHNGPVDVWTGMLCDLRGTFNKLRMKAEQALSADPTLSSGKWCRDCVQVGKCPAARAAGYNAIHVLELPFSLDAMRGQDLKVELDLLEGAQGLIRSRVDAIRADLEHRVKSGDTSSGLVLENGKGGGKKWDVEPKVAVALAAQFGVDIGVEHVLTPTQSVAKIPAAMRPMFEQLIKDVTTNTPGKLKLIPASDSLSARAFARREDYADV